MGAFLHHCKQRWFKPLEPVRACYCDIAVFQCVCPFGT